MRCIWAKRLLDGAGSLTGVIILSPVFICAAALIKLDSRGPAFYRSLRVGQNGRNFYLYKFRSMVKDAAKSGPSITYAGDPRITRVGRVIRKTKVDELPNLINVMRGEMSLVGPRPEVPEYVENMTSGQRKILEFKPGLTGLAQLKYANESAGLNAESLHYDYLNNVLASKVTLDLEYIRSWSVFMDLKIIFLTFGKIIRGLWR